MPIYVYIYIFAWLDAYSATLTSTRSQRTYYMSGYEMLAAVCLRTKFSKKKKVLSAFSKVRAASIDYAILE